MTHLIYPACKKLCTRTQQCLKILCAVKCKMLKSANMSVLLALEKFLADYKTQFIQNLNLDNILKKTFKNLQYQPWPPGYSELAKELANYKHAEVVQKLESHNLNDIDDKLKESVAELINFFTSKHSLVHIKSKNELTFSGAIIVLSKCLQEAEDNLKYFPGEIKTINFHASHSCFIDTPLRNQVWRGININIVSLSIHCVDHVIWDVKGADGKDARKNNQDAENGKAGGNVALFSKTFIGSHLLTVQVDGGAGGNVAPEKDDFTNNSPSKKIFADFNPRSLLFSNNKSRIQKMIKDIEKKKGSVDSISTEKGGKLLKGTLSGGMKLEYFCSKGFIWKVDCLLIKGAQEIPPTSPKNAGIGGQPGNFIIYDELGNEIRRTFGKPGENGESALQKVKKRTSDIGFVNRSWWPKKYFRKNKFHIVPEKEHNAAYLKTKLRRILGKYKILKKVKPLPPSRIRGLDITHTIYQLKMQQVTHSSSYHATTDHQKNSQRNVEKAVQVLNTFQQISLTRMNTMLVAATSNVEAQKDRYAAHQVITTPMPQVDCHFQKVASKPKIIKTPIKSIHDELKLLDDPEMEIMLGHEAFTKMEGYESIIKVIEEFGMQHDSDLYEHEMITIIQQLFFQNYKFAVSKVEMWLSLVQLWPKSLLRLFLHKCKVNSCDPSVLKMMFYQVSKEIEITQSWTNKYVGRLILIILKYLPKEWPLKVCLLMVEALWLDDDARRITIDNLKKYPSGLLVQLAMPLRDSIIHKKITELDIDFLADLTSKLYETFEPLGDNWDYSCLEGLKLGEEWYEQIHQLQIWAYLDGIWDDKDDFKMTEAFYHFTTLFAFEPFQAENTWHLFQKIQPTLVKKQEKLSRVESRRFVRLLADIKAGQWNMEDNNLKLTLDKCTKFDEWLTILESFGKLEPLQAASILHLYQKICSDLSGCNTTLLPMLICMLKDWLHQKSVGLSDDKSVLMENFLANFHEEKWNWNDERLKTSLKGCHTFFEILQNLTVFASQPDSKIQQDVTSSAKIVKEQWDKLFKSIRNRSKILRGWNFQFFQDWFEATQEQKFNRLELTNCDIPSKRWSEELQKVIDNRPDNPSKNNYGSWISDVVHMISVAVKRYRLRDPQIATILAAFITSHNEPGQHDKLLAQMKTGEGKSLVVVAVAIIRGLLEEKTDIVTSSGVLARRDATDYKNIFEAFNISVGHVTMTRVEERKIEYQKTVVYGTVADFQRDYLIEKVFNHNIRSYSRKVGNTSIIVDEVDSMLLDKGNSVLYLSQTPAGLDTLEHIFAFIWRSVAREINTEVFEPLKIYEFVTKNMLDKQCSRKLHDFVKIHLHSWIMNAYEATRLQENIHYTLHADPEMSGSDNHPRITLIDQDTGEDLVDYQWGNGVQQFLQLKHGCKLTGMNLKSVFISNVAYFKSYKNLFGLTGTLGTEADKAFLRNNYYVS